MSEMMALRSITVKSRKNSLHHVAGDSVVYYAHSAYAKILEMPITACVFGLIRVYLWNVQLYYQSMIGEKEVNNKGPMSIVNNMLVDERNTKLGKTVCHSQFGFWVGEVIAAGVGVSSFFTQTCHSIHSVAVGLRDNTPGETYRTAGVVARTRTKLAAVFSLHVTWSAREPLTAERARKFKPVSFFGGPVLVRTGARACNLASVLQSDFIGLVRHLTYGTRTLNQFTHNGSSDGIDDPILQQDDTIVNIWDYSA